MHLLADVYYLAFPSDNYRLKCVVYLAYLVEVVQVVMATHDAFRQFGSGWGNQQELNSIGLSWVTLILLTGFSAVLSQLFYAWRVFVISQSHWISYIISIVSCLVLLLTKWYASRRIAVPDVTLRRSHCSYERGVNASDDVLLRS